MNTENKTQYDPTSIGLWVEEIKILRNDNLCYFLQAFKKHACYAIINVHFHHRGQFC